MADQQDQMTLVAKLVDQVSDKLKEINKAMLATEAASRKAHKGGAEAAEKHRKSIELLAKSFEQVKEASIEIIKPGFGAMGIAAFSLAGAIGAVVDAVKDLGEQGQALEKVTRRSGLMADKIRELQGIGQRWNISMEQTNAGLAQFGDFMAQTERRAPAAMRTWMQMPGLWEKLGQSLQGLTKQQQLDKALDFVTGRVKNIDQKRRILQLLGLPEDYAYLTKQELDKARHEEEKWVAAHPFATKTAEQADEAFTALKRGFQGLRDSLGAAFGPSVVHGVEAINHFLENPKNVNAITGAFKTLGEELHHIIEGFAAFDEWWKKHTEIGKDEKTGLPVIPPPMISGGDEWPGISGFGRSKSQSQRGGGKPSVPSLPSMPNFSLPDFSGRSPNQSTRGGYKPISFGGDGFSQNEASRYIEEPMYRATLRALTEWYQQVLFGNKAKGGGGNGYSNASFGGSDGAAGGGGVSSPRFGNKDFPAVDDDGSKTPAMPSGSRAQNAQRIYNELRKLGHSHEQASAALAHAQAESNFNPRATGDNGTAHGFFQMRGSRWAMARRMSNDPFSPEAAARHFDKELRTSEASAGRRYFGSKSTRDAVTALNGYERFAGWQRGQAHRYKYGENFARKMTRTDEAPQGEPYRGPNLGPMQGAPSAGPNFQDRWQDRYGATRPGVSSNNTDRGLLQDNQSFNDRWNDRVGGSANINVDFKNMPSWVRSNVGTEGKMFKELKVNRGFSMPSASESD